MNPRLLATIAILVWPVVPDRIVGRHLARVKNSLKNDMINRADLERIEQGYYERLAIPGPRLDALADVHGSLHRWQAGAAWSVPFDSAPLVARVDDLREVILKKSGALKRRGVHWHTNTQGMRDENYAQIKPEGTFRIALVGDSIAAGWGVNVDERFEAILENQWNAHFRDAGSRVVEILNFAVPGQSPGQRWYHFSQIGWPMNPDLVICESTAADLGWDERRLRYLLTRGLAWNSPIFRQALVQSAVDPLWDPDRYRQSLRGRHCEILAGIYHTMVADCRARAVPLVLLMIPRVGRRNDAADHQTIVNAAGDAGFTHVIDVTDAYDGVDPAQLAVARSDFHPNAQGHALLARRLDLALRELPELKHLWERTLATPHPQAREHRPALFATTALAQAAPEPLSRGGTQGQ
jgi:lysophospholipase L1-like esterase